MGRSLSLDLLPACIPFVSSLLACDDSALRLGVRLLCRCTAGMTLAKALQQAQACPLLSAVSECAVSPRMQARARQRARRPVWAERGADCSETFYTIRLVNGQETVVKKSLSQSRTSKKCVMPMRAVSTFACLKPCPAVCWSDVDLHPWQPL